MLVLLRLFDDIAILAQELLLVPAALDLLEELREILEHESLEVSRLSLGGVDESAVLKSEVLELMHQHHLLLSAAVCVFGSPLLLDASHKGFPHFLLDFELAPH